MNFVQFCRAHGILIDSDPPIGRWVRYPTTDHPRTRNGAVKLVGSVGWCQNHAQQIDVQTWKTDSTEPLDMVVVNRQVKEHESRVAAGWARAERDAYTLLAKAKSEVHNYFALKGFPDLRGLVAEDGALMIPMRHLHTNRTQGVQFVRWLPEQAKYEKKMMPGMRAKGAVMRLGSPRAPRTWLVEGFATALSVEAALRLRNLRDSVLCCFSDGNLVHVASLLQGQTMAVFADNDASGAGERAALRTGLPYCMSGTVGHDANDMHKHEGVFKVASLMQDAVNSS